MRPRHLLAPVALVLAAVPIASGCSGSHDLGTPTAATAATSPCDALSASDVHRATGWTVARGTEGAGRDQGVRTCTWATDDGAGTVQVQVDDAAGAAGAAARRAEGDRAGLAAATAIDVTGATEAWSHPGHAIVGYRTGDRVVQVALLGSGATDAAALELAGDSVGSLR